MNIYGRIDQTVGRTPLVRANRIKGSEKATVLLKLEFFNPTSSVKDRIAVSMIDDAEKKGLLKPGGVIVEPTSGNTGIGLAMVAAARCYKLILVMPETMSIERRLLMGHFGAEFVLTPGSEGMVGAVRKAEEIVSSTPGAFMPNQFGNKANVYAHEHTTALEIWHDCGGKIDVFVAGVGTGGTLTGVGKVMKEKNPHIKVIAVEPAKSPVISGGNPGPHGIQGIGAGFIPKIFRREFVDEVITVSDENAIATAKALAREEGILCGISAGANAFAALSIAERTEFHGKTIVTVMCDTGERYLSTPLFK